MLSTLLVTQQEVILYHMRQLAMSGDKGRTRPSVYSTQSIPCNKEAHCWDAYIEPSLWDALGESLAAGVIIYQSLFVHLFSS